MDATEYNTCILGELLPFYNQWRGALSYKRYQGVFMRKIIDVATYSLSALVRLARAASVAPRTSAPTLEGISSSSSSGGTSSAGMSGFFRAMAIASALIGGGGCAIHPLPEDVTGVDTYYIVRQIRCETRETIRQAVIDWLSELSDAGDPIAQQLVFEYKSNPEAISTFSADLFPGPEYINVRRTINLFADTGIAYNFDLTMTENNDLSASTDFLRPLTQPKFTLGASAGANWQRTNDRTFTVTDTFSNLIAKVNTPTRGVRYCDRFLVQANYVYPITGRIGVDRLVRDFIRLTLFGNLSGTNAAPGNRGAPTMLDKLTFTTTVSASVNPMVVFNPIGRVLQVAQSPLTADAKRVDAHQVIVALAIAPGSLKNLGPLEDYLFSGQRGAGPASAQDGIGPNVVAARRLTGSARSPSEALAILAIDQIKARDFQLIPPP
jgi:hypothetical protein